MSEHIMKTWGERYKLFENDLCEHCYLKLSPFQRCSWHSHRHKVNYFFVLDGELTVKTEWGSVKLGPGEDFTVQPGEKHEFQTHEERARIIEIAYIRFDSEDIQREKLGGPLPTMGAGSEAIILNDRDEQKRV